MTIKELCTLIEKRKEELFELLCALIKINSENFGDCGNEEECARFIHSLCEKMGLESDIFSPLDIEGFAVHSDYMEGKNLENRYNVVARWKGLEDTDELMLMGHTDTVRIGDLANWEVDPLSGVIKDGKIFGRGACDDKYALATILFIIKLLKEQGFQPKKNLLMAAYCDEEYGGSHGAMAAVMKYPCKRILNADCGKGEIWHCGSGGGEMKYFFHTKETVDSAKTAAMAIPVVIEEIEKFAKRRSQELKKTDFTRGQSSPKHRFVIWA